MSLFVPAIVATRCPSRKMARPKITYLKQVSSPAFILRKAYNQRVGTRRIENSKPFKALHHATEALKVA